jgi:hypothetical protein
MHRLLLLGLLLATSGCVTAIACDRDSDCHAFGVVCDLSLHACTISADAGLPVDAGLDAGSDDAGVPDAGHPCPCPAGQTCRPDVMMCQPLAVRVLSPAAGVVDPGAQVRVVASVTDWDGGLFVAPRIPAAGTAGVGLPASLIAVDAGLYAGTFGVPSSAGTWSLIAGWVGASDSVKVTTVLCSPACNGWEACLPAGDAGACADLGLTLTWLAPTEGQVVAANTTVALSLQVVTADGGAFARPVPLSIDGLSASPLLPGPTWTGTLDAGPASAQVTLVAGWPAGPSSTVHVDIDGG